MNDRANSQQVSQTSKQGGLMKGLAVLGCMGILVLLIVILVLGGMVYLKGSAASQSEIFFRTPQNGEQVEAGQPIQVRILARDEKKILRVEFWADGRLIETQTSSIPGGSNPFPLLTNWTPQVGSHTLIARAFNGSNQDSQASITVEAAALADRDADGVGDNLDACPDQVGSPEANGCPDRDSDGIGDATDACPEVAGVSEDGCPAASTGDSDGDGVLDTADSCPGEPGSPLAGGCPDADGDGVADASDTCPAEAGSAEGCPATDTDGDSVPDASDACPLEPGAPENAGCPESGGGVAPSGEEGGDEVAPAGDDGGDEEGVSGDEEVFGDGGDWEAVDLIQLEALNFSVTQDYDEIFCYAGVVGRDIDRYGPFDALGHHEWDIAEYMGGENSRTLGVELGDPLVLRVECTGNRGATDSFNLGSFTRTYDSSQWDGHLIEELSGAHEEERGDPGHSFRVQFRLCHRSCDTSSFPPPALRHYVEHVGFITGDFLGWEWSGDRADITGYRLYVNGHRRETINNPDAVRLHMAAYMPPCGERYEYALSAYRRDGVIVRESPKSNSVYVTGEACPRRVRVTFEDLNVSDLDYRFGDMDGRGPIYGSLWASGNRIESLDFDGGECHAFLWVFWCRGYQIFNGSYNIANLFSDILRTEASCLGSGCVDVDAPDSNYIIVELGEGDDLTVGGRIWDEEAYGSDERLFDAWRAFSSSDPLPPEVVLEDSSSLGRFTLRIHLEEME